MIFSIEPETRRFVARVPRHGKVEVYDCTADACPNPACRCRTTIVTMCPRSSTGAMRMVGVDLDAVAIDDLFRRRSSPDDLAFAEWVITAMNAADYELLGKLHSVLKNRICEEAKPAEINAKFDFDAVEQSSELQAYNDVLPFGDTFRVDVGGIKYLVLDQYCVKPGCRCTDAHLNLFPITGEGRAVDGSGAVRVDYDAAGWESVPSEPLPCDVDEFRRIMERASPSLYKTLQARHKKMHAIYAHSRQRELQALKAVLGAGTAGRNDPCPCGSGKKYKKCCMGKMTRPTAEAATKMRTSNVMAVTKVPRGP